MSIELPLNQPKVGLKQHTKDSVRETGQCGLPQYKNVYHCDLICSDIYLRTSLISTKPVELMLPSLVEIGRAHV